MVGDGFLLEIRKGHRLASLSDQDAITGLFEVTAVDLRVAGTHGEQGRLVDQIGEIGTAHSRGAACDEVEIDIGGDPLVLDVHLEDLTTIIEFGEGHDHLSVESARAQQCRIKNVGSVGGGDHDDACGDLETVHLREHLVEGLFTFVVASTETGSALATDGVDLVDKDDGAAELAGVLEQIAHPTGTNTDEHLHEV